MDTESGVRLLLNKRGRISIEAESGNHQLAVALASVYQPFHLLGRNRPVLWAEADCHVEQVGRRRIVPRSLGVQHGSGGGVEERLNLGKSATLVIDKSQAVL